MRRGTSEDETTREYRYPALERCIAALAGAGIALAGALLGIAGAIGIAGSLSGKAPDLGPSAHSLGATLAGVLILLALMIGMIWVGLWVAMRNVRWGIAITGDSLEYRTGFRTYRFKRSDLVCRLEEDIYGPRAIRIARRDGQALGIRVPRRVMDRALLAWAEPSGAAAAAGAAQGARPEGLRGASSASAVSSSSGASSSTGVSSPSSVSFSSSVPYARSLAWATYALVAINSVAFVATAALGGGFVEVHPAAYLAFGSNFGPLTLSGEWWRLLSSTYLHFGILHLALNMWALLSTGPLVERFYGSGRFVLLYTLAGIGASLASVAWDPTQNAAGASGAIFGVLGAALAFMLSGSARVPQAVLRKQISSTLVFCAYNLLNGMSHAGIDNAAHVGGLACGFALGWVLRPMPISDGVGPSDTGAGARQAITACAAALAVFAATGWWLQRPSPRLARARTALAAIALQGHDYGASIAHAQEAIRMDPTLGQAYWIAGEAQLLRKEHPAALESLQEAARLMPQNAGVWFDLGLVYLRTGQAKQAQSANSRAIELAPHSSWPAYLNRAVAEGQLRLFDAALADAATACEHNVEKSCGVKDELAHLVDPQQMSGPR